MEAWITDMEKHNYCHPKIYEYAKGLLKRFKKLKEMIDNEYKKHDSAVDELTSIVVIC